MVLRLAVSVNLSGFVLFGPFVVCSGAGASVPTQINHQGVVSVSGQWFARHGTLCFAITRPSTGSSLFRRKTE